MKKLVFAIQVFGLIAAFPIYIVVDFNHAAKALAANNSDSVDIEKPVKENLQSEVNSTIENENAFFFVGIKNCY